MGMLMKDDDDNSGLLMFMMMSQGQQCLPVPDHTSPIITIEQPNPAPFVPPQPEEPEQVIYRTWRINEDGTRTLISTDEHGVEVMHISDGEGAMIDSNTENDAAFETA